MKLCFSVQKKRWTSAAGLRPRWIPRRLSTIYYRLDAIKAIDLSSYNALQLPAFRSVRSVFSFVDARRFNQEAFSHAFINCCVGTWGKLNEALRSHMTLIKNAVNITIDWNNTFDTETCNRTVQRVDGTLWPVGVRRKLLSNASQLIDRALTDWILLENFFSFETKIQSNKFNRRIVN